jgi:hypothetical protein
MQGAAYTSSAFYSVTARKLYRSDSIATGNFTFVADLQSFSNTTSGLDIKTSGDTDTAYYARGLATNSSVYTLNLSTGATTRLLTTPTGTVLREIAL